VAKTTGDLFAPFWGERITIVFDNAQIHINSICDPSKMSSIISFGRNKKNVDAIELIIKR